MGRAQCIISFVRCNLGPTDCPPPPSPEEWGGSDGRLIPSRRIDPITACEVNPKPRPPPYISPPTRVSPASPPPASSQPAAAAARAHEEEAEQPEPPPPPPPPWVRLARNPGAQPSSSAYPHPRGSLWSSLFGFFACVCADGLMGVR